MMIIIVRIAQNFKMKYYIVKSASKKSQRQGILLIAQRQTDAVPYTRVNKRIRLFQKLQGNMRLIPNMRLIRKGKN